VEVVSTKKANLGGKQIEIKEQGSHTTIERF